MKKKINLKIVLGILFVILLVLFGIFFFFVKKDKPKEPEVKKYDTEEIITNDDKMFYNNSYSFWESRLLDYITSKIGYEPSHRDIELNEDGDLVITFKHYDKTAGAGPEGIKVIEVYTISKENGAIRDSKGNIIELTGDMLIYNEKES